MIYSEIFNVCFLSLKLFYNKYNFCQLFALHPNGWWWFPFMKYCVCMIEFVCFFLFTEYAVAFALWISPTQGSKGKSGFSWRRIWYSEWSEQTFDVRNTLMLHNSYMFNHSEVTVFLLLDCLPPRATVLLAGLQNMSTAPLQG